MKAQDEWLPPVPIELTPKFLDTYEQQPIRRLSTVPDVKVGSFVGMAVSRPCTFDKVDPHRIRGQILVASWLRTDLTDDEPSSTPRAFCGPSNAEISPEGNDPRINGMSNSKSRESIRFSTTFPFQC